MLSPFIGGPGNAVTCWGPSSGFGSPDQSSSIGHKPWAAAMADIDGRRNRAFCRHREANSSVGAGIAALLDCESKLKELNYKRYY